MLAYLFEFAELSKNVVEYAYDSVWNVLIRSRHKGVLDDCAVCFSKMTAYCLANCLGDIVHIYLQKVRYFFVNFCKSCCMGLCLQCLYCFQHTYPLA